MEDVIGHLSVEQNSRAKDSHGKGTEGTSVANMVNQRNHNSHKPRRKNGVQQNTDFKKKGKKTFKKNKKMRATLLVVRLNIGPSSAQTSLRSQDRTPSPST